MLEELLIIALGIVQTLMSTTGLATLQRALRDGFRHIQQVTQLQRRLEVGIENVALVVDFNALVALTNFRNLLAGQAGALFITIDTRTLLQRWFSFHDADRKWFRWNHFAAVTPAHLSRWLPPGP